MKLYQYRTLENDSDGDPIDHGVLRATDAEQAMDIIKERLEANGMGDPNQTVRLYPLADRTTPGILDPSEDDFEDYDLQLIFTE